MKLREKIFLIEVAIFLFLALGIVGNNDLGVYVPGTSWIKLIITGILAISQMKYCERKEK